LAGKDTRTIYDYEWVSGAVHRGLTKPIVTGLVRDLQKGVPVAEISGKFHRTLIHMFSNICTVVGKEAKLNRVVLSGGVFQNALLLTGLTRALEKNGFQVFAHHLVPANDGGISLGQAIVAAMISGR
jgi:hydrogenase maturation protein HypF